jgi:hypothetical protein
MKIYVLSWFGDREDGVYGAYSSLERAKNTMNKYADGFHETILDTVYDTDEWLFFTNQGTYKIEAMFLDDNAGV